MSRPILRTVPAGLGFILDEVLEYDIPGLEFESPPRILDVGANIGAFTVWAMQRWPGARITAYEPHPDNFKALVENARVDGGFGPVCLPVAVSDRVGPVKLYKGRNGACHALTTDGRNQAAEYIVVGCQSANDLPPCDVLKLDVEGAELGILRVYRHLSQCKAVLLEWHSLDDRPLILRRLLESGLLIHSEDGHIIRAVHPSMRVPAAPTRKRMHLFLGVLGWKLSPWHAQSREALILEAQEQGWDLTIHPEMASGIERGRNICVALMRAKAPDASHFMFIDSDIAFNPRDITHMMLSGLDVVGGAYPKKHVNWKTVGEAARAGAPDEMLPEIANDFVVNAPEATRLKGVVDPHTGARYAEVDHLGTGFLMIRAEALTKYIEHYRAELEYATNYEPRGTVHHMVFAHQIDPRCEREQARRALLDTAMRSDYDEVLCIQSLRAAAARYRSAMAEPKAMGMYLTEDYAFCTKWQLMGGKVMLALDVKLAHQGPYIFQGHIGHLYPREDSHA